MKLLHIIPALGPGGAARSLATFITLARKSRADLTHEVAVLQAGEYLPILFDLRRQGVEVMRSADAPSVAVRAAGADVVMLHFWNTPQMWRLLAADLPPSRYVLWSKVLGSHPPQLLNFKLLSGLALLVPTAPLPASLAERFPETIIVPGLADWRRLEGISAKPHQGFNVDYIGTTNRGKIHPRFVQMLARLDIPEVKVRICGGVLDLEMSQAIESAADPKRFESLGFVEDIGSVLQTSDVFAYPLAETTYATSDKCLQEAMFAGVPPVIFPYGGPSRFVSDGHDGIVAKSEEEFVAAIEYLHRNPAERARMGRNAQETARQRFAPEKLAGRLIAALDQACQAEPRRLFRVERSPASAPSDALLFLLSQDWTVDAALAASDQWRLGRSDRLMRFAEKLDDDAFQVEGGILHWRKYAMDDPLIRSWTAGWLRRRGRTAEAEAEEMEATRLGAPATTALR